MSEQPSVRQRDLFARRNRLRIVGLVLLATLNYWIAVCAAAIAAGLLILLWLFSEAGELPTSARGWLLVAILVGVVVAISVVVGTVIALIQLPLQRRRLEKKVLSETGAMVTDPNAYPQVRNILEAMSIAAGTTIPRFAVIPDRAPNSFGVGGRRSDTIIGVTTGLLNTLDRYELEAVLAYEVSRISNLDLALSSWTVALTGGALAALDDDMKRIIGWLPIRLAERLQVWALRDQGWERDRAALRFTRHPQALVSALEKLHANTDEIGRVSRVTAPLWVEFPAGLITASSSRSAKRLAAELLLEERILALRRLAGLPTG